MSSWALTASATRLPMTPYPFTATLILFGMLIVLPGNPGLARWSYGRVSHLGWSGNVLVQSSLSICSISAISAS